MKLESLILYIVLVVILAFIVLAFLPRKSQRPAFQEQPKIEQVKTHVYPDCYDSLGKQCKG